MLRLRKIAALFGILFVVSTPLLLTSPAAADITSGLTQDVYTYDSSATPDKLTSYTLCNTGKVSNMNFDVGGDVVANCQADFVLIHWYGYITMPTDGEITFQSMADDGFYMAIGETPVIDNWWLKGCSGGTGTYTFQAGVSQKIDAWFYEYGGGACNQLYYSNSNGWQGLVPDSAFSTDAVVDPPVVEPPVVDPPVVEPPVVVPVDPIPVDPPVVDPPVVDPPVVTPPVIDPPVIVPPVIPDPPVVPKPPVVIPPVVVPDPPVVVPPVVPEPPVVVPTPQETLKQLDNVAPADLTDAQVTQIQEAAVAVLDTATEGSPEYQQALDALYTVAQADDIQVDPAVANAPVVGAAVVGVVNAINALGNIGADMSPAHRATAKKEVVVSVVAVGAAVQAAAGAAVVSSSSPSSRKKN